MPVNKDLALEQWERYRYMRDNGHLDFVRKADKCEAFFAGLQWSEEDLAKLREAKRPAMTINKIISTVSTILGEQIQNRAEVLFRPKNGSPGEVADALSKVWMYISQENQLPWVRSDMFCDGIIRSRGFMDVRMGFNDSMQGEVEIENLNSKNVVIDPDGEEYDPDSWNDVVTTKWMTPMDIATLYNEDDAKELENLEDSGFMYGYDSIDQDRVRDRFGGPVVKESYYDGSDSKQQRRFIRVLDRQFRMLDKQLHFVDVETGDMRPVPPHWDRNKIALLLQNTGGKINTHKKLVKRIKWRVTADCLVLHDSWSPYKHFTPVPYFPYFRYGNTVGVVENLLGPQEILNKASSQELHIINTTANSGWLIEGNSLLNMSIEELEQKGAQTGLVIEYLKGAQPPVKISPNSTPTGLDRVSYKAEEHIKSISNVSDSMQGFDREDVAAKAIQYKTQRGSVNLTKVNDNLQRSDYILARNVLDLVQQYYTEPRILNITHDNVLRDPETVEVNQPDPTTGAITNDLTLGEYDITISSTPHRDSLEDSQFEQGRALRELGIPIPDEFLIENSRLLRRAELIKAMQAKSQTPEAQKQAELEMRGMEAEVANTEADATLKQAKTQAELQGDGKSPEMEMAKAQQEMELKKEEHQMDIEKRMLEIQMKQRELEQKLELQMREHQMEQQIRAEEAQQNAQIREEDAAAKRAQMLRQQATGDQKQPTTQE